MNDHFRTLHVLVCLCLFSACAQIVPPTGGPIDEDPPILLEIIPNDSLLNTRVSQIQLRFDEYVVLNNPTREISTQPILSVPLQAKLRNKTVTVNLPDSLLKDETTYQIKFGEAIRDIHEGNPFPDYTYVFSTGGYFDSLTLYGFVEQAATGLPDTNAVILLYDGANTDSIVLKQKPLYSQKPARDGSFIFTGLPGRNFRIYALDDKNDNLIFDGADESIAFTENIVTPGDTNDPILLRLFQQKDTSARAKDEKSGRTVPRQEEKPQDFKYQLFVDTTDIRKRTTDISHPLKMMFTRPVGRVDTSAVSLVTDSAEVPFVLWVDSLERNIILLRPEWQENAVYTLRMKKGFAKDTAENDAWPGRFTFRTKMESDYARLHVHLPGRFVGSEFLFLLRNESDTVYLERVQDSSLHFSKLAPGNYHLSIIDDENENGFWDTGDLLKKKQPEWVFPHRYSITLKPGWENMIDFERLPKPPVFEKMK